MNKPVSIRLVAAEDVAKLILATRYINSAFRQAEDLEPNWLVNHIPLLECIRPETLFTYLWTRFGAPNTEMPRDVMIAAYAFEVISDDEAFLVIIHIGSMDFKPGWFKVQATPGFAARLRDYDREPHTDMLMKLGQTARSQGLRWNAMPDNGDDLTIGRSVLQAIHAGELNEVTGEIVEVYAEMTSSMELAGAVRARTPDPEAWPEADPLKSVYHMLCALVLALMEPAHVRGQYVTAAGIRKS